MNEDLERMLWEIEVQPIAGQSHRRPTPSHQRAPELNDLEETLIPPNESTPQPAEQPSQPPGILPYAETNRRFEEHLIALKKTKDSFQPATVQGYIDNAKKCLATGSYSEAFYYINVGRTKSFGDPRIGDFEPLSERLRDCEGTPGTVYGLNTPYTRIAIAKDFILHEVSCKMVSGALNCDSKIARADIISEETRGFDRVTLEFSCDSRSPHKIRGTFTMMGTTIMKYEVEHVEAR